MLSGAPKFLSDNSVNDIHNRDDVANTAIQRQQQHQIDRLRSLGGLRRFANPSLERSYGWHGESHGGHAAAEGARHVHHQWSRIFHLY